MRHKPEWRPGCPLHYHDDQNAYRRGCRCPAAREDNRLRCKRQRENRYTPRKVPAVGIRRRIHALCRIGWSMESQAKYLGLDDASRVCAYTKSTYVTSQVARRVTAMYDALCMIQGPNPRAAKRARTAGWAPPLAWPEGSIDDPDARPVGMATVLDRIVPHGRLDRVVVEMAVAGERPHMSRAETDVVVQRLTRRGLSESQIAEHAGISARQVARSRARARSSHTEFEVAS